MRSAICHYSFSRYCKSGEWDLARVVREVEALGVDGIDFHAKLLGAPETAAARIKEAMTGSSLNIAGISMSNNFNQEDPAELGRQIDTAKQWMQVAARMQVKTMRIFGGGIPKDHRFDVPYQQQARQRVLAGLAEVVREAEKQDLILALENHGYMPSTAEEHVAMIQHVNSPHLKATIDVGNYLWAGQEGAEATRIAAPYAAYVHFKDVKKVPNADLPWGWGTEACILGEGAVDHRACLQSLRKAGYTGYVTLEYEAKEDPQSGVRKSVHYMNKILKEPV